MTNPKVLFYHPALFSPPPPPPPLLCTALDSTPTPLSLLTALPLLSHVHLTPLFCNLNPQSLSFVAQGARTRFYTWLILTPCGTPVLFLAPSVSEPYNAPSHAYTPSTKIQGQSAKYVSNFSHYSM